MWTSAVAAALLEASDCIHALSLRGCGMGSAGVQRLARPLATLSSLTRLDLSHNALEGGHTWASLSSSLVQLISLQSLSLNGNYLAPQDVRHIPALC
jgi:Leucine-rich repeat (LRR) protein